MPSAVGGRSHLELDRAGRLQRVDLEGQRAFETECRPALPVRAEGVARGDLHERGERLVEPDPVPPAHRDEVAEPHVGELVGDDVGDSLLLGVRARLRVDEQRALAERDAAEVLHRPGGEVGKGEQVELVARVGDPVVVLEPAQGERPDLEAEAGQVTLAGDVVGCAAGCRRRRRARWPRAGRRRRRRGRCSSPSCRRSGPRPSPSGPPVVSRPISEPFETAVSAGSITSVIANTALNSGSSQHGNARRQSVACI